MAFLSVDDADFWGRLPEEFGQIGGEGGLDGISISVYELGNAWNHGPVMTALRMAPGYVLPRHAHDCYRIEVVMRGSVDVGDGRVLEQGAVMMSEPLTLYGPHIAGPAGCVTLEIFSTRDLWMAEGAKRMTENAWRQEAALGN